MESKKSIDNVRSWYHEVQTSSPNPLPIILVGTMLDIKAPFDEHYYNNIDHDKVSHQRVQYCTYCV